VQCVFAGIDAEVQSNSLAQSPPQILIGTPNRLWELFQKDAFDVSRLQTLAIDEVDRIINPLSRYSTVKMKFNKKIHPNPGEDLINAIVKIRKQNYFQEQEIQSDFAKSVPLQVIASSATVNNPLRRFLIAPPRSWMKKPVVVDLNTKPPIEVSHVAYYFDARRTCIPVSKDLKHGDSFRSDAVVSEETLVETLVSLFHNHNVKRALIFTNSNVSITRLVYNLCEMGIKTDKLFNLHDYSLKIDDYRPFDALLNGKLDAICATEFEARGLDIPDIDHVFMIGLTTPQSYQHVSGRTGRFGKCGTAITLLPSAKEVPKYLDMIRNLGIDVKDPLL
jgi:superfamily II DNA/RNA helicase